MPFLILQKQNKTNTISTQYVTVVVTELKIVTLCKEDGDSEGDVTTEHKFTLFVT